MSWYVLICLDMSWYVLICLDMSWYVLICLDMSWYVLILVGCWLFGLFGQRGRMGRCHQRAVPNQGTVTSSLWIAPAKHRTSICQRSESPVASNNVSNHHGSPWCSHICFFFWRSWHLWKRDVEIFAKKKRSWMGLVKVIRYQCMKQFLSLSLKFAPRSPTNLPWISMIGTGEVTGIPWSRCTNKSAMRSVGPKTSTTRSQRHPNAGWANSMTPINSKVPIRRSQLGSGQTWTKAQRDWDCEERKQETALVDVISQIQGEQTLKANNKASWVIQTTLSPTNIYSSSWAPSLV